MVNMGGPNTWGKTDGAYKKQELAIQQQRANTESLKSIYDMVWAEPKKEEREQEKWDWQKKTYEESKLDPSTVLDTTDPKNPKLNFKPGVKFTPEQMAALLSAHKSLVMMNEENVLNGSESRLTSVQTVPGVVAEGDQKVVPPNENLANRPGAVPEFPEPAWKSALKGAAAGMRSGGLIGALAGAAGSLDTSESDRYPGVGTPPIISPKKSY